MVMDGLRVLDGDSTRSAECSTGIRHGARQARDSGKLLNPGYLLGKIWVMVEVTPFQSLTPGRSLPTPTPEARVGATGGRADLSTEPSTPDEGRRHQQQAGRKVLQAVRREPGKTRHTWSRCFASRDSSAAPTRAGLGGNKLPVQRSWPPGAAWAAPTWVPGAAVPLGGSGPGPGPPARVHEPGWRSGSAGSSAGAGAVHTMDDDEFGGFEAAETFDDGDGGNQATSPAVPWAAFPAVSGVHLSPASPELVLDHEHSPPSVVRLSSDAIISSAEDVHADSGLVSQTIPKAQIQQSTHTHLNIPLFPLGLTDETSNGAIALVEEPEDPGAAVSNTQLQQKISSLETKLRASEEEKQRIKKDVESLMEKHSVLEKGFLKDQEQEAISFQDRYRELQEKHRQELEDMRKAGHEALSIIVDEYKALLQSSVKQQVEAIERQYVSAIERQAQRCEELLQAQHRRLLEVLDTEKELLKEKIQEALTQQSQEQKEILGKCLEEETQRNKEVLETAAKLEKESVKDVVMKAVEEERKNLERVHAEERELWKTEHARDQEQVAQAIQAALQEQRKISQEAVKAAIIEEQKRSEKAMEEAVKRTRDELVEYVREQRRLDQVTRQRSLSSLELFLSCAQKQLSALIATEPVDIE